ncbi:MAG: anthranilate synthase component I, partial [Halobacteria archaeon]|nr:anthranilate synthase component I [Halobacteria archaeon]
PRNLSREEASRLVESVPPFVTTVSVIMPPDLETAVEIAGETGVDAVQVHGGLDPDEVGELRRRTGRKVVTKVGPDVESGTVDEVEENSDGILVDSSDESGGGGTGTTHDWSKSAEIVSRTDTPVILAGGLTPENVPRAASRTEAGKAPTSSRGSSPEPSEQEMVAVFETSREEFVDSVGEPDGTAVAMLKTEVDAETEPLNAYSALGGDYSFLLESAEKDVSAFKQVAEDSAHQERARYSFVGFDPDAVVRVDDREVSVEELRRSGAVDDTDNVLNPDGEIKEEYDSLDALRSLFADADLVNFDDGAERQVFAGGFVGYLAYDIVDDLWLDVREGGREDGDETEDTADDAVFVLSTRNLVFDHEEGTTSLVFTPVIAPGTEPEDVYETAAAEAREALERLGCHDSRNGGGFEVRERRSGDRERYEEAVEEAREHVYDGDIYQAVLSRKREVVADGDPRDFYAELRDVNPSPYMYLLEFDGFGVVGSSPETLFSVHGDRVSTNPIAGTCPRGATAVEDRRLAGEMLSDEKELSEHVMLVDLGRNDVRRVSKSGSIQVDDFMSVVQYSHVQHIESTVSGELRDDKDTFDATRSIFPAGTLSGAPKIRAMEIIDELEPEPRGVYGGGVGYYSWNGDSDFAITIRTATFEENEASDEYLVSVQAGAGIVADSVPESEFEETEDKMDALLKALENLEVEPEQEVTR